MAVHHVTAAPRKLHTTLEFPKLSLCYIYFVSSQKRETLVIATKVRFNADKSYPNSDGLSRGRIMHAVDQSLRNLQTDYIDLYQVQISVKCWNFEHNL